MPHDLIDTMPVSAVIKSSSALAALPVHGRCPLSRSRSVGTALAPCLTHERAG